MDVPHLQSQAGPAWRSESPAPSLISFVNMSQSLDPLSPDFPTSHMDRIPFSFPVNQHGNPNLRTQLENGPECN